jgi:hypothetical protein
MRSWRFVTSAEPETATQPAAPAQQPVGPKSVRQTVLDMFRSLGLMVVIIAITLIFGPNQIHPGKSSRVQPANFSSDAVGFRQVSGQPALIPAGLPSGWYANGATFTRSGTSTAHLHIGWVTPDKKYVGLDESNAAAPGFIASILGRRGATSTGSVSIAGSGWDLRTSSTGELALTSTQDAITVVLTGSASADQQQQLAAALQPDTSGVQ